MDQRTALFELSASFHSCRDIEGLGKTLAVGLARSLPASAILVWLVQDSTDQLACRANWSGSGTRFEPEQRFQGDGVLAQALGAERATRFHRGDIAADSLTHFAEHDRERVESALYVPLPAAGKPAGVIEVLNHASGRFSGEETAFAEEAGKLAGRVLETLRAGEQEKHETLATIERLSSLYDISCVFNSTLELDDLTPLVAERVKNILDASACNLWLVDAEASELYLAHNSGDDSTVDEATRLPLEGNIVGEVARGGTARLVADAGEAEDLTARTQGHAPFRIQSWMAAPLVRKEEVLGVLEIVNRNGGEAFGEDDLFFLQSLSEQATIAIHNANLLEAERKVNELGALLKISKEITSTLNLDHLLTTVVNEAATVLPFDRCVIGLFDRSRFVIGAVSGESTVPENREMEQLRNLLEWTSGQPEPVSADQYEEGWETKPEGAAKTVVPFLQEFEYCGFYAMPLRDDQGVVGVLALVSGDAEFLNESHLELLSILAGQTTVAIRNARLYNELPLMSIWQPLVKKKQALQQRHGGLFGVAWKTVGIVLLLVLLPWKMRVATNATVIPAERRTLSAQVEGVVRKVLIREGDQVESGAVLAELDSSENRSKLSAALASLETAGRQLAEAENQRDLAAGAQARIKMDLHRAEADLYRQLVEHSQLKAPGPGVVITPKVEEKAGTWLAKGSTFCELVNQSEMAVEMNVPETDIALLRDNGEVTLKLNSFPLESFPGRVVRIGAQTISAEGEQFFVVRAKITNSGGKIRPGMVGRAKISAQGGWGGSSWYPIGYVLLRDPGRWVLQKIWLWLP